MATAATMDVRIRDLHRVTSEERAFQSEYNFPPVKCSTATGSGSNEKEVRWALRGYLPPKHLRIPGYAYGLPEDTAVHMFDELPRNVRPRESIAELMAGCFVPGSERDEGMSEVTVVDTSRTVKGNMSSRPSWGHQAYSMAQQAAQAAGGGAQSVAV